MKSEPKIEVLQSIGEVYVPELQPEDSKEFWSSNDFASMKKKQDSLKKAIPEDRSDYEAAILSIQSGSHRIAALHLEKSNEDHKIERVIAERERKLTRYNFQTLKIPFGILILLIFVVLIYKIKSLSK